MTYLKMLTYYARNDRSEIAGLKELRMSTSKICMYGYAYKCSAEVTVLHSSRIHLLVRIPVLPSKIFRANDGKYF